MKVLDTYLEALIGYDKDVVKKTKVAGAVIIKKGENDEDLLLLIMRSKTDTWDLIWEFPRGHVEQGESLIQGLKREVREETGLDVIPTKYIGKFTYIADEGKRETTQYNYLCKMKNQNQKVKLSHEHDDFQWVSQMGIVELLVPPEMKKIIARIFNVDTQIVYYPEKNEEILE